jgi:hypothetical protein
MKKIVFFLSLMFISSLAFSQLGLGIKGAFTMSQLSTDIDDYTNAMKAGYQFGAFVRIGDKLHLQPEAYFTAKSGELESESGNFKQSFTFNTIDVPVLLGYKILDPPAFNVRLQAGPVASFVASKSISFTNNGIEEEATDEQKDSFKNVNWGLQMGAGVDFLFVNDDVRYELGLSNMYDKPSDALAGSPDKFNNNVFFISVGWKIL